MAEAKGKKLRRCSKQKNYYATQFQQTEKNQKLKLSRHVRNFPNDFQAYNRLVEMVGGPKAAAQQNELRTAHGTKILKRAEKRA